MGGLVNYHKYEAQETSGNIGHHIISIFGTPGTPLLSAQQTLSIKHKNACVGSVECQRHRVRLDSVRVMICHVTRVRPCPGHVCPAGGGTRCDVIQTPLAQSPL